MNNEIKQGDKVRVSKDAPEMYFFGCNHDNSVYKVILVDRDNAVITQIKNGSFAIPTKYLIKVDAKAKEPKIKLGDMVRVKNLHEPFCLGVERHLEIPNIPPHAVSQKEWKVISIEVRRDCAGRIYTLKHDDSFIYNIPEDCVERVEPKEQTEAEKTDTDNIVDDFAMVMEGYRKVFADIADSFDWQRYEADLAKEVALKVANKYNNPKEVADYAVSVAKAVVENL